MIGKNIQKERKKLKVTQKVMAKILECKQSNISMIENQETDSTIIKYIKFLRKNKVDLNNIFDN